MSAVSKQKLQCEIEAAVSYAKFSHMALVLDLVKDQIPTARSGKLLAFYGAYRQYLSGDNRTTAPSVFAVESRAKWHAWSKQKGMSKADALQKCFSVYRKIHKEFPHLFKPIANANIDTFHPFQGALLSAEEHTEEHTEETVVAEERKADNCSEVCTCGFSQLVRRMPATSTEFVDEIMATVCRQRQSSEDMEIAWRRQLREVEKGCGKLRAENASLRKRLAQREHFYQTMKFMTAVYDVKQKLGSKLFYAIAAVSIMLTLNRLMRKRRR